MASALSLSSATTTSLNFLRMNKMTVTLLELEPSSSSRGRGRSLHCTPLEQIEHQVERQSMCEPCGGIGWLLCDFCKGQKTNVKSANNRIHRRCPSCKAVGCILCSKCKVFKCVTFPNISDASV